MEKDKLLEGIVKKLEKQPPENFKRKHSYRRGKPESPCKTHPYNETERTTYTCRIGPFDVSILKKEVWCWYRAGIGSPMRVSSKTWLRVSEKGKTLTQYGPYSHFDESKVKDCYKSIEHQVLELEEKPKEEKEKSKSIKKRLEATFLG